MFVRNNFSNDSDNTLLGLRKIVETAEKNGQEEPICSILFSEAVPGEYVRIYDRYKEMSTGNSAVYFIDTPHS